MSQYNNIFTLTFKLRLNLSLFFFFLSAVHRFPILCLVRFCVCRIAQIILSKRDDEPPIKKRKTDLNLNIQV